MASRGDRAFEEIRELLRSRIRPPSGAAPSTVVGQIVAGEDSPSQTERFWRFRMVHVEGPEEEGSAASFYVVDSTAAHCAINLGSKNPIHGQRMLFHNVDGYWIFECHGAPTDD